MVVRFIASNAEIGMLQRLIGKQMLVGHILLQSILHCLVIE